MSRDELKAVLTECSIAIGGIAIICSLLPACMLLSDEPGIAIRPMGSAVWVCVCGIGAAAVGIPLALAGMRSQNWSMVAWTCVAVLANLAPTPLGSIAMVLVGTLKDITFKS